jgi:hypothetical protein
VETELSEISRGRRETSITGLGSDTGPSITDSIAGSRSAFVPASRSRERRIDSPEGEGRLGVGIPPSPATGDLVGLKKGGSVLGAVVVAVDSEDDVGEDGWPSAMISSMEGNGYDSLACSGDGDFAAGGKTMLESRMVLALMASWVCGESIWRGMEELDA